MKLAAALALALALHGCRARTSPASEQHASDASDASPNAPGSTATAAVVLPEKIETVAFDPAARFLLLQGPERALVADLRVTPPRWRGGPGVYEVEGAYQTFGLSMEANRSYPQLRTVHGGTLAVVDPPRGASGPAMLEDLTTGARRPLPSQATATEDAVLSVEGTETVVTPFDGPARRYASILELGPSHDLLVGSEQHGDDSRLVVADPQRPETLTIDAPSDSNVEWLGEGRARLLVVARRPEGPTTIRVLEFPAGTEVAATGARGLVTDHRASEDGALVAWSEVKGEGHSSRCTGGLLHVGSGRTQALAPVACAHEEGERPVDVQGVSSTEVLLGGARMHRFDPTTARALPLPKSVASSGLETPLELGAFSRELAALRRERPEVFAFSPLLRDAALLEARHGYDVLGWGDAGTVLVRRGSQLSLCTAARGENCRPVTELDAKEPDVTFSADGSKATIVAPGRVLVIDGRRGTVLADLR